MEFGDTLARLRKSAGRTATTLAQAIGVEPDAIAQIERGDFRMPERRLVLDLARALDLNDAQTDELLWSANHLPYRSRQHDSEEAHTVAMFVDHENVYIALNELVRSLPPDLQARARRKVEPKPLAAQIRSTAEEIGWVKVALAVADWERLPAGQVKEYLKLRYQVDYNLTGRNNADLKLSDAIRNVLEDDEYEDVDTYVLVTGDGGYLTVLDTLLRRQKRVFVWGVHGATNQLLAQNATGVAWIDEILGVMDRTPEDEDSALDGLVQPIDARDPPVGNDVSRLEALAIHLARYLQARSWSFITFVRFLGFLDETGIFGQTREEQLAWLSHAKETLVLREEIVDDPADSSRIARRFHLNERLPLVERAWAIKNRVGEIVPIGGRGLAFGVVVDRLINDSQLQLTDVQAKNWLTWLVEAGYLQAEQVPHFRKEGVTVTLLRQVPGAWDEPNRADLETDQERLMRAGDFSVVRLANFLDRHPHFGWMALSQLLNRMAGPVATGSSPLATLTRQDAKQAIALAQEREYLTVEQIPNLKTGGTTTVARINRDEPRVAGLIALRDALIRRLANMLVNRPAVSRTVFQSAVADTLRASFEEAGCWIDFLVSEGIFLLDSGPENSAGALRTDQQDLIVSRVLFRANPTPFEAVNGSLGVGGRGLGVTN
ncbi:MAG: helix-turn-helix domain-containing protein [Chloroflexota bacterium]